VYYRSEFDREKEQAQADIRKLKGKLKESNEVTRHFQDQIERLERKIHKQKHDKVKTRKESTACGCSKERQLNVRFSFIIFF